MAKDTNIVNGVTTASANTVEVIYTNNTNGGAVIKAVSATNKTKINAAYTMYIIDFDGTTDNPIVPFQSVVRLKVDTPPEVINQVVPAGGTIRVKTTAANSIAFTITAKELVLN